MKCRMCETSLEDGQLVDGICLSCRETGGLPKPGPALRPRVPCQRCGGKSLLRVHSLREHASTGGDHTRHFLRGLALSYDFDKHVTLFRGRNVLTASKERPLGPLEAYACRSCGLVELYARDVGEIPIGPEYGTELFEVDSTEAYR